MSNNKNVTKGTPVGIIAALVGRHFDRVVRLLHLRKSGHHHRHQFFLPEPDTGLAFHVGNLCGGFCCSSVRRFVLRKTGRSHRAKYTFLVTLVPARIVDLSYQLYPGL